MRNEWRLDGKCTVQGPEELQQVENIFYLGRGGKANKAKLLCDDCPVKKECLAYALYYGIDEGIWGGLTPDERKQLPRVVIDILLQEVDGRLDTNEQDYTVWLEVWLKQTRTTSDETIHVNLIDDAIDFGSIA